MKGKMSVITIVSDLQLNNLSTSFCDYCFPSSPSVIYFILFLQGIGKQGVLMKESSTSSITDWKSRYFHLVEDGLIYYESTHNVSQVSIH